MDTASLIESLAQIREQALALEKRFEADLQAVHPDFQSSARNLLHYVALRQLDVRQLQDQLARLGLSSLGRAEKHVLPTLGVVERAVHTMASTGDCPDRGSGDEFLISRRIMDRNIEAVLGEPRADRRAKIMVTLPTEAATDPQYAHELLASGMDVARINCSHDGPEVWRRMADNVREGAAALGRDIRIVMDLAGPKLRTGELRPGPKVLRLSPRRDLTGNLIAARRIQCVDENVGAVDTKPPSLPVPHACIDAAQVGDTLRFVDTRGRHRHMRIVTTSPHGFVAELDKTVYVATGTSLRLRQDGPNDGAEFLVGDLPHVEQPVLLRPGDTLILDKDARPGAPATMSESGDVLEPARVPVTPPEIVDEVQTGEPVLLNDGKIAGIVESRGDGSLSVTITRAKAAGSRLRSSRSINFPASRLTIKGLTEADRENLAFAVEHADAIGLSFVRTPSDVLELQAALDALGNHDTGIILKIETADAFSNLPRILLAAMRRYPAGVMIARGDLAVECGWVRLAVMQEEILWLCEAARVPVIWATQVLEGTAKKGLPTRAEVTDAAMSQRADCVMLNKGPHIVSAIAMLDDILRRMQVHQRKKTAQLVRLGISDI